MGSRYLRGFVGSKAGQDWWLGKKLEGWRDSVANLAGVECFHPQTAYMGMQKSLQQKGYFVQHVTPEIGMTFQAVEDELRYTFLPDLFPGATSQIPWRAITGIPVKQAKITLPNPTWNTGAD